MALGFRFLAIAEYLLVDTDLQVLLLKLVRILYGQPTSILAQLSSYGSLTHMMHQTL